MATSDSPDDLPQPADPELQLLVRAGRLTLVERTRQLSITVDFLSGDAVRRRRGARRRDHPLARAVGRRAPLPAVLDGTAGLGRDAFVLATLGYAVTACERSPVLCAMLRDGLQRARAAGGQDAAAAERIVVCEADSRDVFRARAPEVVYLDPMFPARRKSALVKKEMQLLQRLLGPDADAADLVAAARAVATDRVVVKRPAWSAPLAEAPDFTVEGSRVRWDVYLAR